MGGGMTNNEILNSMLRTRLRKIGDKEGRDYLLEALRIVQRGNTLLIPERKHLEAMAEEICRLQSKIEGLEQRLAVRPAEKETDGR